jgi:hypothetical protein
LETKNMNGNNEAVKTEYQIDSTSGGNKITIHIIQIIFAITTGITYFATKIEEISKFYADLPFPVDLPLAILFLSLGTGLSLSTLIDLFREKTIKQKITTSVQEARPITANNEVYAQPTCFKNFTKKNEVLSYFKARMNGKNGMKQAGHIHVTHFEDPNAQEKGYFDVQNVLVTDGDLEVRRILLIKDKAGYEKMCDQLRDLGTSSKFELGIYLLAADQDPTTIGNFRNYLNFNFMVIDDDEFCFNNGNSVSPYDTSSIVHRELAQEIKKYIGYLWNNSHQIKTEGLPYDRDKLMLIQQECIAKKILLPTYDFKPI